MVPCLVPEQQRGQFVRWREFLCFHLSSGWNWILIYKQSTRLSRIWFLSRKKKHLLLARHWDTSQTSEWWKPPLIFSVPLRAWGNHFHRNILVRQPLDLHLSWCCLSSPGGVKEKVLVTETPGDLRLAAPGSSVESLWSEMVMVDIKIYQPGHS